VRRDTDCEVLKHTNAFDCPREEKEEGVGLRKSFYAGRRAWYKD